MKARRKTSYSTRQYPPGSFVSKLKKRRIPETLAAFVGGGWLVYEVVHWVLVDHYHLPEGLKDIAIMSILGAMLCVLAWRWFRGDKRRRRIKLEWVVIPVFVLITLFINVNILLRSESFDSSPYNRIVREGAWKNSIAVLPFVDMSADKNQEYFSDGLTEELLNDLSNIQELRVAGRTSSFQFKGKNEDLRVIGQKLNVATILEGSVRKEGNRVRITAQLNNAADGFHLWSQTYDRELDDVFVVQDEIAGSVARALEVTLLGKKIISPQTTNTEAYNAYLQGRYFYQRQTKENLDKAIVYYEQAVRLDPNFAQAWVGLAATRAFQSGLGYLPPKEGIPEARVAVERALALDNNLAYAHSVKGWIQMNHDWDWSGAEDSFQRALYLAPGKGAALSESAQLAVALGRFERALKMARRLVKLDPLSTSALFTLAMAAWYSGRLDEAASAYKRILELVPENAAAHSLLGEVYLELSGPIEALAEIEQEKDPYWRLPAQAMAYHVLGRKKESEEVLDEFITKYQAGGAYNVAQVFAFRGEVDQAFMWLERAYIQHDGGLFLVKVDPFLKNIRQDSRYVSFLKKMNLPV